ncbi:MAG: tRNA preQ1(34) S-adenosylmethionine ribosyltransferase-isomerase QueA [Bacillota bacterium]|nr:tRNA preQ1(34) S-adenosylmethionine ribosyltransferase-isomerase QueA [Bacillota bacterium]
MIEPSEQNKFYELETYRFDLPSHLIAQYPIDKRDHSRLLVLDKKTGAVEDRYFYDVVDYFSPGDTLVLNETRVIPARLYGQKDTGARVEVFLLQRQADGNWEALVRPAKRLKPGSRVLFEEEGVEIEILADLDIAGGKLVRFNHCEDEWGFIERVGNMPLPPYINRAAEESDKCRYQTVFGVQSGSSAAPTAGLHFTEELLEIIKNKGINIETVLLHVGLGTFRPVNSEDIRDHHMHYESYKMTEETAQRLNQTRRNGGKIIAVGTTVVRTLETIYNEDYGYCGQSGETNKFIYPGYELKGIDRMITNFHLPGSSLIMLVSAFSGLDHTMQAYRHAVDNEYRFFSYGDAMLIR